LGSTEWSVDISNTSLTFSNGNKTTMRVGSVSSYPAAFARLTGERCSFHVTVDEASISSNWLTFGITKKGMATSASDGMGRTAGSWGIQDDRSDASAMPTAISNGSAAATLPRKLQVGDRLSAEVDTSAGWCEVQLNQTEFKHRFTIPVGSKEDYWFGMTFANDHKVTVGAGGGSLPVAAASVTAAAQPSGHGPTGTPHSRCLHPRLSHVTSYLTNSIFSFRLQSGVSIFQTPRWSSPTPKRPPCAPVGRLPIPPPLRA
jgi:hypothetical protein